MNELIGMIGIPIETGIAAVLDILKVGGTGAFLALLITLGAAAIIVSAFVKFRSYIRKLRIAIRAVETTKDTTSFAKDFNAIHAKISGIDGLSKCWREFKETLIFPDEAGEPIRNTARPSIFFDANETGFTTPILRIFPNIFVGIGLVLTFAGLIAALLAAVSGIESGSDSGTVQRSIVDLLRITSAKFYTSLTALLFSILMTLEFRFLEARRDKYFNDLLDRLEERLEYVSVESLAQKQLKQVEQQTLILEQFNNDLAMKIGSHIQEAVKPLVDEISNIGGTMSGEVVKNIHGAAEGSLNHLSDRLNILSDTLGNLSEKMSTATGGFEKDIKEVMNNMKEGMKNIAQEMEKNTAQASGNLEGAIEKLTAATEKSADQIGKSIEKATMEAGKNVASQLEKSGKTMKTALDDSVNDLATSMNAFSGKLQEAEKSVNGVTKSLQDTSEGITKSAEALAMGSTQIEKILAPVAEASTQIQSATKQMNAQIMSATSEIKDNLAKLQEEMQAQNQSWEKHSQQFDGVNERLGEIFKTVNDHIENSQGRMTEFVTKLDITFKTAVGTLQEAVEEFANTVEDLKEERKAGRK